MKLHYEDRNQFYYHVYEADLPDNTPESVNAAVAEIIARGATFRGSAAGWRLLATAWKDAPAGATCGYNTIEGYVDVTSTGLPLVSGAGTGPYITTIHVFADEERTRAKTIRFRVSEEEYRLVTDLAAAEGCTISQLLRARLWPPTPPEAK